MRVDRAIRLGQMREIGDLRHLERLSRFSAANAGHVDDPAIFHTDLPVLRLGQREADPAAFRRGLGRERQFGDAFVVGVVDQRLLDVVKHLRLVGGIVLDAAMPIEMVVGDVGDRRAVKFQRIGEMQLERAQFDAEHVVRGVDGGVRHGFADVANGRERPGRMRSAFRRSFPWSRSCRWCR